MIGPQARGQEQAVHVTEWFLGMDPTGRDQSVSSADGHPAAIDPELLARQCEFQATRRGGPGGQNRNKVETAVVLTHRPTGVVAQASERRSQVENRREALYRLRLELAVVIRQPIAHHERQPYRPSALWRSRCRGGRLDVNPRHDDFPALLAEVLDVLFASDQDPKAGAILLGCSPSQLIKFLKESPRAWRMLNDRRLAAGQHPLF